MSTEPSRLRSEAPTWTQGLSQAPCLPPPSTAGALWPVRGSRQAHRAGESSPVPLWAYVQDRCSLPPTWGHRIFPDPRVPWASCSCFRSAPHPLPLQSAPGVGLELHQTISVPPGCPFSDSGQSPLPPMGTATAASTGLCHLWPGPSTSLFHPWSHPTPHLPSQTQIRPYHISNRQIPG